MTKRFGICFLLFWLVLSGCGRKRAENESTLIRKETLDLQTLVPKVDWIKTLVFQPPRNTPPDPTNATFLRVLNGCILDRLGGVRELKVQAPPDSRLFQELKPKADYLLAGETEKTDRGLLIAWRLTDLRKNTILWQTQTIDGVSSLFSVARQRAFWWARAILPRV